MILCMCPMCQLNLDAYQSRVNGHFGTDFKLPIIFFTQLLGVAFGHRAGEAGLRQGDRGGQAGDRGQTERGRGGRHLRM